MSTTTEEALNHYASHAFGTLQLKGVRIGRMTIAELNIFTREAAINAQELFNTAFDRTRRRLSGKQGTRYPEPLPMATPARLLSVEIRDHLGDMDRRGLKRNTLESTARTLKLLQMTCGDIPVSRIDHKHFYALWELMRWAPPNLLSAPELKSLSYDDAIAHGKELDVPPPAPATLEKHRRFLVSFFNQLVRTHAIPFSPVDAFAEAKKSLVVNPNKPERLFNAEELQRIFAPETFIPWARLHPHRWWAPMIGLCTGARINEVCQLKVADIVKEGSAWCIAFRVTVDPDLALDPRITTRQTLKGRSAVRTIPIPQALLDAGFMDFVADMKACGHPRLFPHLSAGVSKTTGATNARYSQGLLAQFGAYLKTMGFPKGVGFHAFRHTFATEVYQRGVSDEDIALVTGHSVSKRVPVLHDAYFHKKPELARAKQSRVLGTYSLPLTLPVYQRGQFRTALGKRAKFYP
jgi:integrase